MALGSRQDRNAALSQATLAGESLTGKTILLYAEQGLGDAIQFARYVPLLAASGARVVLEVHKPLRRLMQTLPGVSEITGLGQPTPPFDVFQALMSVPGIVGTTGETIPASVPYLAAEPDRVARWQEHLRGSGFKVGIVWQGKGETASQRTRSAGLHCFTPLARVPGVRLISLQKTSPDAPVDPLVADFGIETLGPDFDAGADAFLDSAAVMESLDLVITIDTSTAHLAGALNRPVWIALKQVPDWRWTLEGATSPWYPSARLFRQPRPGDWESVFAQMAQELTAIAHTGNAS